MQGENTELFSRRQKQAIAGGMALVMLGGWGAHLALKTATTIALDVYYVLFA